LVAFGYDVALLVHFDGAVGANHDACPAAHAFILIMRNQTCFFISVHGTCEASLRAGCVFAVSALYRERDWFVHFYTYAADWTRGFSIVGFNYVL
jgi:hypothetical protein